MKTLNKFLKLYKANNWKKNLAWKEVIEYSIIEMRGMADSDKNQKNSRHWL